VDEGELEGVLPGQPDSARRCANTGARVTRVVQNADSRSDQRWATATYLAPALVIQRTWSAHATAPLGASTDNNHLSLKGVGVNVPWLHRTPVRVCAKCRTVTTAALIGYFALPADTAIGGTGPKPLPEKEPIQEMPTLGPAAAQEPTWGLAHDVEPHNAVQGGGTSTVDGSRGAPRSLSGRSR
jgi:hypothetical protein